MGQIAISERVLGVLEALEPDVTIEAQIAHLAQGELRRRLARYQLSDRLFREKYGMSLDEFETRALIKELNYSFEVESDHQDWDLAVDGIRSMERQLAELRGTV
ncbi:MAG: hypothetical protein NT075_33595 [Chloroflexi bacterium]|nr:hypothetical protein [Chloroflexota bacterium]